MITYLQPISACVRAYQRDKAMVLILEIWQKGLEANVIAYNTAISAIESAKQRDEAMALLGDVAEGPGSRRDHLHATISAS